MKLYYGPGTCALAPHLLLNEIGLPFTAVSVNIREHKLEDGGDFYKINPRGYVPVLELDNKQLMTEAAIILQYIADRKPEAKFIPAHGSMERYRVLETVHFIATELHKSFGPLFSPTMPEEAKQEFKTKIAHRFDYLNKEIPKDSFTCGKDYTIADPYLFTMLTWAKNMKIDVSKWPNLLGQFEKVRNRPATVTTIKQQGLEERFK